jgi:hypothetical protein
MLHEAEGAHRLPYSTVEAEKLLRRAFRGRIKVVCVPSPDEEPEEEAGAEEVAAVIVSSGAVVAAYRLLKIWVKARNGRKLKIKVGDVEVEATQMKEEDVLRIFELLQEKADRKKFVRRSSRRGRGAGGQRRGKRMEYEKPVQLVFTVSGHAVNPQTLKREILRQMGHDAPLIDSDGAVVVVRVQCERTQHHGVPWEVKSWPPGPQELQQATEILKLVTTPAALGGCLQVAQSMD